MAYTRLMNGIYVTGDYLEYGDVFDSEGHIKSSILTVDAEIDATSTNPIQNQAVAASIGQATSAATSASASAASAAASATAIATDVAELKEAIEALPDSQAVAVTVAEHTVALAALEPLPEEVEDLKEIVEPLEDVPEILADLSAQKANIDGHYDSLTSGMAENLVGKGNPVTNQSFYSRVAGGANAIEDGIASYAKIKGNAVKWNQLQTNTALQHFAVTNTGTSIGYTQIGILGAAVPSGHKVIRRVRFVGTTDYKIYSNGCGGPSYGAEADGVWHNYILTQGTNTDWEYRVLGLAAGESCEGDVQLMTFDLTAMGIADLVNSYEDFLKYVPMGVDMTAYNAGDLLPNRAKYVKTSKEDGTDVHSLLVDFTAKATNFNLWDEQWELGSYNNTTGEKASGSTTIRSKNYIEVEPSKTYYILCPELSGGSYSARLYYYKADGTYISTAAIKSGNTFTPPSDSAKMAFYMRAEYGTSYANNICINVSLPNFNGKYVPYGQALPIFPDGGLAAGAIYDEQSKSGCIKRVGKKVFDGTEEILSYGQNNFRITYALPDAKITNNTCANALCNLYEYVGIYDTCANGQCTVWDAGNYYRKDLILCDNAYTSAEAWGTHLAALYAAGTPLEVYYELANPTEISYADYPQDWGTERQIDIQVFAGGREWMEADGNSAPIVADIKYGIDYPTQVEKNRDAINNTATIAEIDALF